MKKVCVAFLCLALNIAAVNASWAQENTTLSRQARESIYYLNPEFPASFPACPDLPVERRAASQPAAVAPWPTIDWAVSTPEARGMDGEKLLQAIQYASASGATAVLVIRNGYLVQEWYVVGWGPTTTQRGFSIAKSFTSAIVGMLIDDGLISDVNRPVSEFVPEWRDWQHSTVTIKHLLSMNSGLYWSPIVDPWWLITRPDQTAFALSVPMEHFPGTTWVYSSIACQVLSELILQAGGMQAADYARDRLWNRIGMWDADWMTDRAGNTLTYQSVIASAREFAKFGYLYLREGAWEDGQIISRDWIMESTQSSQDENPLYGYLFWLNTLGLQWPDVPADAFAAMGRNYRRIYVVPSLDLVVVRLGDKHPWWSDNFFLGSVCNSVIE